MLPWVRRFLTVACFVLASLVVRPAAASAPLCDQPAASVSAPTPTLDASSASLDVSDRAEGCDAWERSDTTTYDRGETPVPAPETVTADVLPLTVTIDIASADLRGILPLDRQRVDGRGFRGLLERPPR